MSNNKCIDENTNENSNEYNFLDYNSISKLKIDNLSISDSDTNNDNNKISSNTKFIIPKNKTFMILHEEFVMYGWDLIENKNNYLVYTKKPYLCDEFIILINSKNDISVTIPVSNSNISYKTSFTNYFSACEFISMHLKNYEKNIKYDNLYK